MKRKAFLLVLLTLCIVFCLMAVSCSNDDTDSGSSNSETTDSSEGKLCETHIEEIISGKEPTCTETGLTEGKKCSVCGEITVEQVVIPTQHTYENSYTCSLCGFVSAIESVGLEYELDTETNTYVVTGIGTCTDTDVVIPYTYEEKMVAGVSKNAFKMCVNIVSIRLPNSVTSIGEYTFKDCTSLTTVTIPNSVTSIGKRAFSNCTSLKEVHINDIGAWCAISFADESAHPLSKAKNLYLNGELVTELVIPESVTSIADGAFYECDSLTTVTIPNSVISIGDGAFRDCDSLTNIEIPNSVTSIGSVAFLRCTSLTSVTIPNSVTSIGEEAFEDCTSLTSIEIPNSVTSIGEEAFEDCTSLTSIEIPNSVTSIGYSVFYNCTSLTIYCEAESQPEGWDSSWNYSNCPVEWGYTKEN